MTDNIIGASEVAKLRNQTPGVNQVVHFNNAGAALIPEVVENAVSEYFKHEVMYGGYETAEKFSAQIEATYNNLARYLNCSSSEIALCQNATAAWDQAFLSIPFQSGDKILCSVSEYASNYLPFLQLGRKKNVTLQVIPNDEFGQVDVESLAELMDEKVKLVAITHVPTNGGLVNPAIEIGRITKKYPSYYLLDACQSVGQMPLNVNEIGCDFLSGTSRKYLRGPRGVGFLFASKNTTQSLEPVVVDLHAATWKSPREYQVREDARKFESWENNLSSVVGLGVAVNYMLDIGVDGIWQRIQHLANYLRNQIKDVPGLTVRDLGQTRCGIVSISMESDVQEVKSKLQHQGINVSIIQPGHTLLDMGGRGLGQMIRASVHYYNTESEIDLLIESLRKLT